MKADSVAQEIVAAAQKYGYDGCGILRLSDLDFKVYGERVDARLKRFPDAIRIYRLKEIFQNIRELHPWAKALIICKFWLGRYQYPNQLQGKYGKAFLLSPQSAPECQAHHNKLQFISWLSQKGIRVLSDEAQEPAGFISLRPAAVAAGLGIFRRNNFFYDEKGSWHQLEGFLIDRDCEYIAETEVRGCPEKCNLCMRACPTSSLCEPFTMNPMTCVSFITTFGDGKIAPFQPAALKDWICGCDACQDACPFNRSHNWRQGENFDGLDDLVELLMPQNLLAASDETLREKVIPKTIKHLQPDQTGTLRICARRALQYEADTGAL